MFPLPSRPFSPPRRRHFRGQNYELIIETTGEGMDWFFNVWGNGLGPAFQSAKANIASIDDLEPADGDFMVRLMQHSILALRPRCAGMLELERNDDPIKLIELAKQHDGHG